MFYHLKFPYSRFKLSFRLKQLCKRKGYKFIPAHPLWNYGNIKGKHCDFYVVTAKKVYSVKLIGAYYKMQLNLISSTGYSARSLNYFKVPYITEWLKVPDKIYNKSEYNFKFKFDTTFDNLEFETIILANPVPLQLTYQTRLVYNSHKVPEGTLYNASGFLSLLGNQ